MSNPAPGVEVRLALAASVRTFLRLPVAQRSSVLLMDVLGHSLEEIAGITGATVPAVKAALHRGRERLRELAAEPDDAPVPSMTSSERAALEAYVHRFNAHDFDAVRNMLAEEVQLDLVARTTMKGKREVQTYFSNYDRTRDWHLGVGFVEGRPAILVSDPARPGDAGDLIQRIPEDVHEEDAGALGHRQTKEGADTGGEGQPHLDAGSGVAHRRRLLGG